MRFGQKILRSGALLLTIAVIVFALGGCQRSSVQSNANANRPSQSPFEKDLDYVRNGQFTHIYVFARKDGGQLQADDITYLKTNSPAQTNMWLKTDDGRRAIAGSNFDFKPEHLDALSKRFNIEDYSGR